MMADDEQPLPLDFFDGLGVLRFESEILGRCSFRWALPDRLLTKLQSVFVLDNLLQASAECWGPVRVANVKGPISKKTIEEATPTVETLKKLYGYGYTIVVNDVDQKIYLIREVSDALKEAMLGQVNCNGYVTPAGCQDLKKHYDDHDVFVVQVAGVKKWEVYHPRFNMHPVATTQYSDDYNEACTEKTSYELTPGDVLYIPAGFPHEAYCAAESASTHLSFSLQPLRVADMARYITAQLEMAPDCKSPARERVSPSEIRAGSLMPGSAQALLRLFHELTSNSQCPNTHGEVLYEYGKNFVRSCSRADVLLEPPPEHIDLDDTLRRSNAAQCLLKYDGSELSFPGGVLSGGESELSVYAWLIDGENIAVRDLPGSSAVEKIDFAKDLIRAGFMKKT
jgi:hypothetical protein